jgi:hypothetical protein
VATLGGNARWDGNPSPNTAGNLGARIVRWPLDARVDPLPYVQALKARGLVPLPAIASLDAFKRPGEDDWIRDIAWYAQHLGPHISMIQVLNECDGAETEEGASWRMGHEEANVWLAEARLHFPRPRYRLIGPGLVSGNPEWVAGLRLDLLDSLSPHPYSKSPGTPELQWMLDAYASYGLPLTITEFDSRTRGMAAYLRDEPTVEFALTFCLHSYDSYGLVDHPEAAADFLAATGGPVPMPTTDPFPGYSIQPGFVTALQQHGYTPLSDERYFNEDMSVLLAEKADSSRRLLLYNRRTNDVTIFDAARIA